MDLSWGPRSGREIVERDVFTSYRKKIRSNQALHPYGGPGASVDNSSAPGGPPSVSGIVRRRHGCRAQNEVRELR